METKIEIRISAPEIVEALRTLASALGQFKAEGPDLERLRTENLEGFKTETLKEKPQEYQKFQNPEPAEKYEQLQMDLGSIKLEDIREKISKLAQQGRGVQIRELLNKFGSRNLTEIPEEKYGELLREVEKC